MFVCLPRKRWQLEYMFGIIFYEQLQNTRPPIPIEYIHQWRVNISQCTISLISRVVHVLNNPHDIGHVLLVADGCCDMANKIACLAASILGKTNPQQIFLNFK